MVLCVMMKIKYARIVASEGTASLSALMNGIGRRTRYATGVDKVVTLLVTASPHPVPLEMVWTPLATKLIPSMLP